MAYEHTPDAAQILGRRIRFTDMFEKRKKREVQMVRAKEGWNKGSLTDKSLFHLSTHCPGYKMEVDLKPPPKKPQTKKQKVKKRGREAQSTPEHKGGCARAVR